MREGDRDAVAVLGETGDRVAEDVLDVVLRRVVQDSREIAAQDLQFAALEGRGGDDQRPAVTVHIGHFVQAGRGRFDLIEQAHPLEDAQGRAAEVDRVAAVAQFGCAFDDRRREAVAVEPAA